MRIAVTGARGTVGQEVVKLLEKEGHYSIQVNRTDEEPDGTKNSEFRTADIASSYDATVKAFKSADAVIHLAMRPNPLGQEDWDIHANNVGSAFNAMRACGELGIKRISLASSVNAIGLAYANQPLKFKYFPIDEEYPPNPTDSYALAKQEAEVQAAAFVNWFPGTAIASLRIHEVAPLKDVQKEHKENPESSWTQLWGWVNPVATARACLLGVTSEKLKGHEIFNIIAPTTTQATPSKELAEKYYPEAEIRGDLSGNQAFWTTDKAKNILGWEHTEKE